MYCASPPRSSSYLPQHLLYSLLVSTFIFTFSFSFSSSYLLPFFLRPPSPPPPLHPSTQSLPIYSTPNSSKETAWLRNPGHTDIFYSAIKHSLPSFVLNLNPSSRLLSIKTLAHYHSYVRISSSTLIRISEVSLFRGFFLVLLSLPYLISVTFSHLCHTYSFSSRPFKTSFTSVRL